MRFIYTLAISLLIFSCAGMQSGAGTAAAPTAVSAGPFHTLAVAQDGTLWAWGAGGLIGDGSLEPRHTPVRIMENVISATAGETHSLVITQGGTLWAFGHNFVGQIGDGTTENRLSPVPIMEGVIYATIAPTFANASVRYSQRSFAITEDGTLWGWGQNGLNDARGLLGDGGGVEDVVNGIRISYDHRLSPVMIMENVRAFSPTIDGGFAITGDNVLWGWGTNWNGELGDGTTEIRASPVMIKENVRSAGGGLALTTDGRLWELGIENTLVMENIVSFAGGQFAIDTLGRLWAWGENRYIVPDDGRWDFDESLDGWNRTYSPPIGDGTTEHRRAPIIIMEDVVFVTTTLETAYAITADGTLWGWGINRIGQLGDGTTEARLSPVRILEGIVYIASNFYESHWNFWIGHINTFALSQSGEIFAWGGGGIAGGATGDGTTERRLSPVRVVLGE